MIAFDCPSCHKHVTAPDECAGVTGPCPYCANPITAPGPAPVLVSLGVPDSPPERVRMPSLRKSNALPKLHVATASPRQTSTAEPVADLNRMGRWALTPAVVILMGGLLVGIRLKDTEPNRQVDAKTDSPSAKIASVSAEEP